MKLSRFAHALVLGLALASAGCGDDSSPTAPSTPANPTTATFTGTLAANGANSHVFTALGSGTVTLTLTSLALDSEEGGTPPPVGISLGGITSLACTAVVSRDTAVQGDTITGTTAGGSLCARIFDAYGLISTPVTYTLTVVHP